MRSLQGPRQHGHGALALFSNTTGFENTANGYQALAENTTGIGNTANGFQALFHNIEASFNTASGLSTLSNNTTGEANTGTGAEALLSNTTGFGNTANGFQALLNNTESNSNTAIGFQALYSHTIGDFNTATGGNALQNSEGRGNTAIGWGALLNKTDGNSNIALGFMAGQNLTAGRNNIYIGDEGAAAEDNTIRIGTQGTQTKTFIAGVTGAAVTGVAVKVNAAGQIGTAPSSARFKQNIKPMDKASDAIHALKPVTFHYKKEIDSEGTPHFGLVAEEVEKVNPDLVVRDKNGEIYTVRYDAVNAMLLNEFLKEHRRVGELASAVAKQEATNARQQKEFESAIAQQRRHFEATTAQQQKEIQALTASLKKQAAQIQMVSNRIELSNPRAQIVLKSP